jgi:hypothetical protein
MLIIMYVHGLIKWKRNACKKSVHKLSKKNKNGGRGERGAGRSRGLEWARKKMESFDKQWQ